ncbi:MAG: hypothetical protein GWQ05_01675 [Verrucomicrobiaceae bacterium]|nr:hypothetical protein [Verrucomicrobiaceae bacterium]
MNKPIILHGTWCLVAMTSFVIGYRVFAPQAGGSLQSQSRLDQSDDSLVGFRKQSSEVDSTSRGGTSLAITERDIKSLGETFRKAASPIERRLAFSKLLEGLTSENALLIREQIAHLDHRSSEFQEFHYAWGATDGEQAAVFGASTPEDDMSPALAGWASGNPSEALAWFNTLRIENDPNFDFLLNDRKIQPDRLREHLMRGLVKGLADNNPNTASEFVHELTESGNKAAPRLMHTVADAVMRSSKPSTAVDWAETLPQGNARTVALRRMAERYVDENPTEAAAWASKFAKDRATAAIVGEVGANWSHRAPKAALEWLSALPTSHGQNAGLHRSLSDWTHRDPAAASEYLSTMPDSPARNAAITGFSSRLAWEDPTAALVWAETITSEGQRHESILNIGRAWARKDAEAAADWAANAGLPENVQQAFLNPPKDKRRR